MTVEQPVVVVFDVLASDRLTAGRAVVQVLAEVQIPGLAVHVPDVADPAVIESWWLPEADLKQIDGNDNAAMHLEPDDDRPSQDHHDTDQPEALVPDALFRLLLNLTMQADPAPWSAVEDAQLRHYLDEDARARGFDSWEVAFHQFRAAGMAPFPQADQPSPNVCGIGGCDQPLRGHVGDTWGNDGTGDDRQPTIKVPAHHCKQCSREHCQIEQHIRSGGVL